MRYSWKFFVVLSFWCLLNGVSALGGAKCGEKTCKRWEYCSAFDHTCQPCKEVCDNKSHNFDGSLCTNDCQDYLYDKENLQDLRSTVQQLSRTVTVTLSLVCLILVVLAAVLCFQVYRWKVKKNITFAYIKNKLLGKKVPEDSSTSKNNIPMPENKKNELRLDMPSSVTHSDHSPVTVTTSISRRPAEDSTLDYAYDNPAMTRSPK